MPATKRKFKVDCSYSSDGHLLTAQLVAAIEALKFTIADAAKVAPHVVRELTKPGMYSPDLAGFEVVGPDK